MVNMMTDFYTNVSQYGNHLYVRGFNEDGSRMQRRFVYEPYLFVPSTTATGYTDIHGNHVQKKMFDNIRHARDFIKKYEEVEGFNVYGLDRYPYVFIYDTFRNQEVDTSKINIVNIDIEGSIRRWLP